MPSGTVSTNAALSSFQEAQCPGPGSLPSLLMSRLVAKVQRAQ